MQFENWIFNKTNSNILNIFIHGFGSDSEQCKIDFMTSNLIQQRASCLFVSAPYKSTFNNGRYWFPLTSNPLTTMQYSAVTASILAEEITSFIEINQLKINSINLFGHSQGGSIASLLPSFLAINVNILVNISGLVDSNKYKKGNIPNYVYLYIGEKDYYFDNKMRVTIYNALYDMYSVCNMLEPSNFDHQLSNEYVNYIYSKLGYYFAST